MIKPRISRVSYAVSRYPWLAGHILRAEQKFLRLHSLARQPRVKGGMATIHEVFNLHPLAWSILSRLLCAFTPSTWVDPLRAGELIFLTTRWNFEPLYPSGLPPRPLVSPIQNCRKFSAVLGTTSGKSSILIRPRGSPDSSQLA